MSSQVWQDRVRDAIAIFGHRNWVVVADSAYPAQIAPGIETIVAEEDPVEVLRWVLDHVNAAPHISATVYTDAELPLVEEEDAPGVTAYRRELEALLSPYTQLTLPHEEILSRLDEAGRSFRILVVKSRMRIPYSSIFIQLGCGYWTDAAERKLRASMLALR